MPSNVTWFLHLAINKLRAISFASVIICAVVLVMMLNASVQSSDQKRLDLESLEGDWIGSGTFLMPVTEIEVDVEGKASFRYDSKSGRLRTALSGEKFMFTYSDSGYVTPDAKGDSLIWEVWDGFGRHSKYRGAFEGNSITGSRRWKGKTYSVEIIQLHADTLSFKMTVAGDDGTATENASFSLKRVK